MIPEVWARFLLNQRTGSGDGAHQADWTRENPLQAGHNLGADIVR
jgi:hypothetical protein